MTPQPTERAISAKRDKAKRYATEPSRMTLESANIRFRSDHGERHIVFQNGSWSCTCPFYADTGICSHIMAAKMIYTEHSTDPASDPESHDEGGW